MDEKQTRTERNSKIQTIVLSVILPFAFLFGFVCSFGNITDAPIAVRYFAKLVLFALPILYYFIVMRERKGDILLDSNKKRIILSLSVQAVTMLVICVIPFGYMVFFTKPENGHWSGEAAVLLLVSVICPLAIHLGGCLVSLIFRFIHK
jgi:uncharacterized membrane protein YiaA